MVKQKNKICQDYNISGTIGSLSIVSPMSHYLTLREKILVKGTTYDVHYLIT